MADFFETVFFKAVSFFCLCYFNFDNGEPKEDGIIRALNITAPDKLIMV